MSNIFLSLTAHLQQDQLPQEEHLKKFADWLRDRAKWTKWEEQEVYKCESEDLHEAITPLLKELKLQKVTVQLIRNEAHAPTYFFFPRISGITSGACPACQNFKPRSLHFLFQSDLHQIQIYKVAVN